MKSQGFALFVLMGILLAACSSAPVSPPVPKEPEPVVEAPKKAPAPTAPARRPPPPVYILLSDDIPAYREVADKLMAALVGRAVLVDLAQAGDGSASNLSRHPKPGYQQYVAIGHGAAESLPLLLDGEDIAVFCQLFNYHEVAQITPRSKGVSAVPSAAELFSVWHRLNPQLGAVGVITGPGLETVIREAEVAARAHGIALHHRVVASDKEMLYAYKQLSAEIDGLWLLPDNRILSRGLLRELMSYSVRHAKQLAVFNDELLKYGGLLSISADPAEIAEKVLQRLALSKRGKEVPGVDLMHLERGIVRINPVVAERFNLVIADDLRAVLHEP